MKKYNNKNDEQQGPFSSFLEKFAIDVSRINKIKQITITLILQLKEIARYLLPYVWTTCEVALRRQQGMPTRHMMNDNDKFQNNK